MRVVGLDHVQVSIPAGGETAARAFYVGVLGLVELTKPAELAARGGCWFAGEGFDLHLGVDPAFQPALKAHVAFIVEDLGALRAVLRDAGLSVADDDAGLAIERCYTEDPFGNRVELVAAGDRGFSRRGR